MHIKPLVNRSPPWDRCTFLSKYMFSWVWSVFLTAHKKDLDFNDLYRCPKANEADTVRHKLEKQWHRELVKEKPSLFRALFRTFAFDLFICALVSMIQEVGFKVGQTVLLGYVVRYLQTNGTDIGYKWTVWSAVGIVLCSVMILHSTHLNFVYMMKTGLRMRTACCALIYRKSMRLSRTSLAKTTVGQIINMMSNDCQRFDEFCFWCHSILVAPLQLCLVIYILWGQLEYACLAGVGVLLLFIPFQGLMGRMFQSCRRRTAPLTDKRICLMNEIIAGMRVIKMYTWERPFAHLVSIARKKEIHRIRQSSFLKGINLSFYFMAVRIILYACCVTMVLMGRQLTPERVFVSIAFFNIMRITITKQFPNCIASTAELNVVIDRIQTFLLLDEMTTLTGNQNIKSITSSDQASDLGVYIDKLTVGWNNELVEPTLTDINVSVKSGELLAVIGTVGCGKSSLLMSILNELPVQSGTLRVKGRVSYAPQESWAFMASVRDNILFGADYDQHRYDQVVKVCALERDFRLFPYGDRTLVGERGVSLSGGQRARITLARAIYHQADIYLLDDPLSAVDAHVAKHLFQKCIVDYLKDKARILVTHQIQFLKEADKILVLNEGRVIALGTYHELRQSGVDFLSFIKLMATDGQPTHQQLSDQLLSMTGLSVRPSLPSSIGDASEMASNSEGVIDVIGHHEDDGQDLEVKKESKKSGSVDSRVYWNYTKAGAGPLLFTFTILVTLVAQVLYQGADLWLTQWTNAQSNGQEIDLGYNIMVYSCMIGGLFVSVFINTASFYTLCMRSSVRLYNSIFYSLLRAPIHLFDSAPVGQILNRFTKDTGIVDELLPSNAFDFIISISLVIGNLIVNALVNWYLVFPAIVLLVLVYLSRCFYIRAARDIKRMEGLSRSPIYSHVTTTLTGLSTVRSFGVQTLFERQFGLHLNDNTATYFLYICTSRAFGVLMDWICVLYISTVVAFVMLYPDELQGGSAGLIISSALTLTTTTQYAIKCSADLESYMTAVERMLEYSRVEPEAPFESTPDRQPPADWPQNGQIVIQDMSLQYHECPKPVLRNISVQLMGGQRVGVVGRTGAGKSSLIAALFRLTEPEGLVLIDGLDIKRIGLRDLRSRISIIPQEPTLFTGTVRQNLDPFGDHPDDELWSAIDDVQLRDVVAQLPGLLDALVIESGANLSVGQRQLVCLARAILRDNRVLVLDEATANVDHRTDALIQYTIRHKFRNCTVITIAHRINTIIDSDVILVLDAGELLESGTAHELLERTDSLFGKLVDKTGKIWPDDCDDRPDNTI